MKEVLPMHTALIVAAAAGIVATGTAVAADTPTEPTRAVRVTVACAEQVSSYPASSIQPGKSCSVTYTGYLRGVEAAWRR